MKKVQIDEKKERKRNTIGFILNIVFWVVLIGLAIIWMTDFLNVRNDKEPKFCISNKVHEYEDGTVTECTGLGYKVFTYKRTSMNNAKEFGPFFIKIKE